MKDHCRSFVCTLIFIIAVNVCCSVTGVSATEQEKSATTPPRPNPVASYHATYNGTVENTTYVFTGGEFVDGEQMYAYKTVAVLTGGWETVNLRIWGSATGLPGHDYVYNPNGCTLELLEYTWAPFFSFLRDAEFQKSDVINGQKCDWWLAVYGDYNRMSVCFTAESVPVRTEFYNTSRQYIILTYLTFVPGKPDASEFVVPSQCKKAE
eukprot:TRINITY_DN82374_c0_g1_i1.p1 TRINITY_DN82374_c0_g1~~TRINITY_DN82374_c0_g1_i1.p1  ORF type:complete len:209 (+),score=34.52 TRINITY_DN82374_c0_g1_i1:67-693(+)